MDNETPIGDNLLQTVPFFAVSDMENSISFYVDKLGFEITQKWINDEKLRWCWLQRGGGGLMLQEFRTEGHDAWVPECKVGEGVSVNFICQDALAIYHEITERGVKALTLCRERNVGYWSIRSRWLPALFRKLHRCAGGNRLYS